MKKKYILPAVLLMLLAFVPSRGNAAIEQWTASKAVAAGVKSITGFVQTVIRLTDSFGNYDISFSIKFPVPSGYYNRLAIKFGNSSNPTYQKMLEMWTSKDGGSTYIKGLEFAYKTDSTKALIVFHTGPFITAAHPTLNLHINSKFKLEYDGSVTATKWMKFNSDHGGVPVNNVLKTCAYLEKGSTYYDVYVTSHLGTSLGGTAANDAYTFGARILTASTAHYYTLAKQGISDIKASGSSYDFLLYGDPNAFNCALFDKADADGFVQDGYTDSTPGYPFAGYPLVTDVVESKLPDVDDVENATFTFATPDVF